MIGAIIGDIIGSRFEKKPNKSEDFELFTEDCTFTDDTVLTVATMYSIINTVPFSDSYKKWYKIHPNRNYGSRFKGWVYQDGEPYGSFGNGSAMRVSPIGWAYDELKTTIRVARGSALVTHNHWDGINGAEAVATCIFMARQGKDKEQIRELISNRYDYNLDRTVGDIRQIYKFDNTARGSVPEAIICFLDGTSYEDIVRKAVSLGGDSDTQACIAGGIAEAYYGIPDEISSKICKYIHPDSKMYEVIKEFYKEYIK